MLSSDSLDKAFVQSSMSSSSSALSEKTDEKGNDELQNTNNETQNANDDTQNSNDDTGAGDECSKELPETSGKKDTENNSSVERDETAKLDLAIRKPSLQGIVSVQHSNAAGRYLEDSNKKKKKEKSDLTRGSKRKRLTMVSLSVH